MSQPVESTVVARLEHLRAEGGRLATAILASSEHRADRAAPTGRTGRLWRGVQPRIEELSSQLAALQQLLDQATDIQQRADGVRRVTPAGPSSDVGEPEAVVTAELSGLLAQPCEVVTVAVTGAPRETVRLPLAELLYRAAGHHDAILAVVKLVGAAETALERRMVPLTGRLTALTPRLVEVAGPAAVLDGLRAELDALRTAAETDPVSVVEDADWASRSERLASQLSTVEKQLDRAEEASRTLPTLVRDLRRRIDRLAREEAAAGQAWQGVSAVPGETPPARPAPRAAALRGRLRRLEQHCQHRQWWAATTGAEPLTGLIEEVAEADAATVRDREAGRAYRQRLDGLRAELRGRLEAYRHKASSLRRAEDLRLTALYDQARAVLRAEPFDAPAADRAVWEYQCAVNQEVPG